MKKIWMLVFLVAFLFTGMQTVQAKMIHIGETQIVSHPALNNDSKGFKKALEEEGFIEGKNVVFDRKNAQGEMSNCYPIAQKFADDKVDLIHAISTPSAQACVKVCKGIPIVFSSVTDPVKTGIVPKLGKTGTRVTGVSDRWPIALQCKMYQKFLPKAKRWGTIYNPGDINVTFHIKEMKKTVEGMGGKLIEAHVSSSAEVMQAAQSLVGRVDAIHITSDNACVSALEAIVKVCNQNKIPLFVGDRDSVPRGAIAAYGLDYFLVGYEAGKKAAQILKGKNPGEIPAGQATKFTLWINLKAAKIQGVKVPKELLDKADKVWGENGKVIKGS
ncbi:MAG: ABC transporter substrate-binding protein [Deltaproteobacteria bacterium]|nr:ABC transporter substrate-binding protein [Deltaproteobacteria bacterium]